jgi:hypothetical protein
MKLAALGLVVVAACLPLPAHASDDDEPVPLQSRAVGPHVQWSFGRRSHALTIGWIEAGDRAVWTRKPPGRMAGMTLCCWTVEDDAHNLEEYAPIVVGDAIAFEDSGQLSVLSRKDGSGLFEWTDDRTSSQHDDFADEAIVDYGTVEIRVDGTICKSDVSRQSFVRGCGRHLVVFDQGLLVLVERDPYRLAAVQPVTMPELDCRTQQEHRDRTVRIGGATVRVTGTRISGCIVN